MPYSDEPEAAVERSYLLQKGVGGATKRFADLSHLADRGCDVKTAEKQSPVGEQVAGFGLLNKELADIVQSLDRALTAILEPTVTEVCGGAEKSPREINVPLALHLKQENGQLYQSICNLRRIKNRIAV